MTSPILTTARLRLRPLAPSDSAAVFAMMADDETMRFWDWPPFTDTDVVEDIVAAQLASVRSGDALYWATELAGGGPVVGVCDLSDIDMDHRRAELGFLFARPHWGHGYAREAMEKIVAHAFGPLGLERLWARFHAGNDASKKLLTHLGFTPEGILKAHILRDGERRDCEIYGRVR